MSALKLTPREVAAFRTVLTADDAEYDRRVRNVLLALHRLIPCDWLGLSIGDPDGFLELAILYPDPDVDLRGLQVCQGPLHTGIEHLVGFRDDSEDLRVARSLGVRDFLRLGFPLGGDRVVQIFLDRTAAYFEPRHVTILSMLEPALARQLRPPESTGRQPALSPAERRVLHLVARGARNQDVADMLSVSEATVRKHLEHIYRKLGVRNRTAASALVLDQASA